MWPYPHGPEWEGEKRLSKLRASAAGRNPVAALICFGLFCLFCLLPVTPGALAQEELPKGSIEGTIIDESGSPLAGATVYANSTTAEVPLSLTTDKDGKYTTGPLKAGAYTVLVEARNFRSNRFFVNVRNGQTSNGDRKLVHIDPGTPTLRDRADLASVGTLPVNGQDPLNAAQV